MAKRPFMLTDLEDLALAACDDMYLESTIAQDILSTWYERKVPLRELRAAYLRLIELGLLRSYVKHDGRVRLAALTDNRTSIILVRATKAGNDYLGLKRRVA